MTARRSYESATRDQQRLATRSRILEAAEHLFEANGYVATGVGTIAESANVSLRTVYLHFDSKSELLRELWHLRLRSEDEGAPVARQPWFAEVLDEPDPARQLELNMRNSIAVKRRVGSLFSVIRQAAVGDRDAAELWARIGAEFRENQRSVIASIAAKDALRPGISVDQATDLMWSLNHPDYFELLCTIRGWSPTQYRDQTLRILMHEILGV